MTNSAPWNLYLRENLKCIYKPIFYFKVHNRELLINAELNHVKRILKKSNNILLLH